jgi:hypothetical protein
VASVQEVEAAADTVVVGFIRCGGRAEDEELGMEEKPVDGVVLGFPVWVIGIWGRLKDGAGSIAGTDDVAEEGEKLLVELGTDEVSNARTAVGWTGRNVVVNEAEP